MPTHVPPQIVHAAPVAQLPAVHTPSLQTSGCVQALPSQLALPFGLNRQFAAQHELPDPLLAPSSHCSPAFTLPSPQLPTSSAPTSTRGPFTRGIPSTSTSPAPGTNEGSPWFTAGDVAAMWKLALGASAKSGLAKAECAS